LKKTKIHFIGRKQGVGFRRWRYSSLENRRKFEYEGFLDVENIQQVRLIQNADVVWCRVRPEHTSDLQREIIDNQIKKMRGKIPIINDIEIFDNYDCKDISFDLWSKANIACPNYIKIDIRKEKNNLSKKIQKIQEFISTHGKMFLRTNNETAANGIYSLDESSTEIEIKDALKALINRCESFHSTRKATNIVGVKFIRSKNEKSYQDLYRVHVLFGKVLSFYSVTSPLDIFHNINMSDIDIDRFIQLNHDLCKKMSKLENKVLDAAKALDCNLGAVEFFLQDDKPIFLELNPMWGGHASKFGFGNNKMQNYLRENRDQLIKLIPNIYDFMNRRIYYKNLFQWVHRYCSTNL
tara:strand:- start:303 stop:1358 length:1056 start_codon:yes stop_codon:yes gene_type:complete